MAKVRPEGGHHILISRIKAMRQLRGAQAVSYARNNGIYFDVDRAFLIRAESELTGDQASLIDIDRVLEDRVGRNFDPEEIAQGGDTFDFLVNRYGDGWIYVAVEGDNPDADEKAVLSMFRRLLKEKEPSSGNDVKEVLLKYGPPRLHDKGFKRESVLNILFHAALRLSEKGLLVKVEDQNPLPAGTKASYGRRRFFVPADVHITLEGVLCDGCRRERLITQLSLHRECLKRLRKALLK
jgi:hypothetical protein